MNIIIYKNPETKSTFEQIFFRLYVLKFIELEILQRSMYCMATITNVYKQKAGH